MNVFEQVRNGVTISQAIDYLGLKATETKGEQLRFACPACKGTDKRTLSVNLQKGFRCFSGDKKGDDATALVAHVKGIRNGEAAQLLKAHFLSSSTEPRAAKPEERERSEAAPDVLAPLTDLQLEHPVIEMLGLTSTIMETLGGGYCGKGTMAGRILIPLRTETGELKGYCGIATKAEQSPLLLFPRSLEARCKPIKPEPDELRRLFRVV
jgi:hypothetical protein